MTIKLTNIEVGFLYDLYMRLRISNILTLEHWIETQFIPSMAFLERIEISFRHISSNLYGRFIVKRWSINGNMVFVQLEPFASLKTVRQAGDLRKHMVWDDAHIFIHVDGCEITWNMISLMMANFLNVRDFENIRNILEHRHNIVNNLPTDSLPPMHLRSDLIIRLGLSNNYRGRFDWGWDQHRRYIDYTHNDIINSLNGDVINNFRYQDIKYVNFIELADQPGTQGRLTPEDVELLREINNFAE